jgi:NAD(P)-dependent dehydrogenase (short-subunit alcohol dehydrogenase family)
MTPQPPSNAPRRLGSAEEVAKATYFLCAEQSRYVHGAEPPIDGGQHV